MIRELVVLIIVGPVMFAGSATAQTCCVGEQRGDVNLSSVGAYPDLPTIGDISAMIHAKFIVNDCIGPDPNDPIIACLDEADVNLSATTYPVTCDDITIGDISLLIEYLFIQPSWTWPHPPDGPYGYGYFTTGEAKIAPCPVYEPPE